MFAKLRTHVLQFCKLWRTKKLYFTVHITESLTFVRNGVFVIFRNYFEINKNKFRKISMRVSSGIKHQMRINVNMTPTGY